MRAQIALGLSLLAISAAAQTRYEWTLTDAEGAHGFGVTDFNFQVSDSGPLSALNVGVILPNTWQGDYKWELIHSGVTLTLIDRPGHPQQGFGFSADNYGNLGTGSEFVLSDVGALHYDLPSVAIPGVPNVTGNWLPDAALSAFDGAGRNGLWTLRLTDSGGGDTGVLRQFSLTMVPESTTLVSVGLGFALIIERLRRRRLR